MGEGYDQFLIDYSDRRQVLYVGANDGMLHCFDVLTGEELWAFIPYNLLPKLRNMRAVDNATGARYFNRDIYVDGTPTSADVYIDADGDGNKEWRTILICGQGAGYGSSVAGGLNYYFALDITDPENPQPLWEFTHERLGETWSVPAIGKVIKNGEATWVAFVGSGYDNNSERRTGNRFYAIDLETGEEFWLFDADEVDTSRQLGWDIENTIPCSPSTVDIDQDGFVDRVYVGDLDGRLWKIDVSNEFQRSRDWEAEAIYEDNHNYPIISQPAVWIDATAETPIPRIYFGTGGDDRAPDDVTYSFIALMDGARPEVEWFIGDHQELNLSAALDKGDLGVGEKVWADPKIADYIVYFSTLTGSIESVDPCESLVGIGKLYARFIVAKAGNPIGSTAFRTATGPAEALNLEIKTRSAVTIGESERVQGQTRKREVYIQEYNSTLQRLEQSIGALLRIKSWREIFKIIR
jgi:Tfp pilus tip-associated adhesin PilY1